MSTLSLPTRAFTLPATLPVGLVMATTSRRALDTISVYVVDDHAIFRRGMAAALLAEPALAWSGEADSVATALREAPALQPDVVLVDMVMPGMDSVQLVHSLRALLPRTRFVAISCTLDAGLARRALHAGVTGYLLKTASAQDLTLMIRAAHAGRRHIAPEVSAALDSSEHESALGGDLTRRERRLLELMACGLSNQEIGARMDIGLPTVKFHVTNVLSKLHAENRTAAVLTALRQGLVALPT